MRSLLVIGIAIPALTLTACSSDGGSETSESPPAGPLEEAYDSCADLDEGTDFVSSTDLGSDGTSVIVDSAVSAGAALNSTVCILGRSDAPETIAANMGNTTAMMGRQSATYDDITVQWSYSASDGGGGFQATFDDESAS